MGGEGGWGGRGSSALTLSSESFVSGGNKGEKKKLSLRVMEGVSSPECFFSHIFTSASLETSSPVCPSVWDPAECSGAHQPGFSHRVTVKYKVNNTAGGSYLSHWLSLRRTFLPAQSRQPSWCILHQAVHFL